MKSTIDSEGLWHVLLSWIMVIRSSFWKYFLQNLDTMSSQFWTKLGVSKVYHVYVQSMGDFENALWQRSWFLTCGPIAFMNRLICSFGLAFLPSIKKNVEFHILLEMDYGRSLPNTEVVEHISSLPWVACVVMSPVVSAHQFKWGKSHYLALVHVYLE